MPVPFSHQQQWSLRPGSEYESASAGHVFASQTWLQGMAHISNTGTPAHMMATQAGMEPRLDLAYQPPILYTVTAPSSVGIYPAPHALAMSQCDPLGPQTVFFYPHYPSYSQPEPSPYPHTHVFPYPAHSLPSPGYRHAQLSRPLCYSPYESPQYSVESQSQNSLTEPQVDSASAAAAVDLEVSTSSPPVTCATTLANPSSFCPTMPRQTLPFTARMTPSKEPTTLPTNSLISTAISASVTPSPGPGPIRPRARCPSECACGTHLEQHTRLSISRNDHPRLGGRDRSTGRQSQAGGANMSLAPGLAELALVATSLDDSYSAASILISAAGCHTP